MASSDNQSGTSRSSGATSSTSSTLQSATSTVSDLASQASDRVRDQASRAAGQVQDQTQAFLSEQKVVAADHLEGVAKVLHDTVDQLRQRSPGAVTDYAERAVDGLDSVAHALREQDLRTLVGEVEDFARRQPVLFLAGTVAIGFALARFLKSSSRSDGWSYGQGSSQHGAGGQGRGGSSSSAPSGAQRSGRSGTEFSRHISEATVGEAGRATGSTPGRSDYHASDGSSGTSSGGGGQGWRADQESG